MLSAFHRWRHHFCVSRRIANVKCCFPLYPVDKSELRLASKRVLDLCFPSPSIISPSHSPLPFTILPAKSLSMQSSIEVAVFPLSFYPPLWAHPPSSLPIPRPFCPVHLHYYIVIPQQQLRWSLQVYKDVGYCCDAEASLGHMTCREILRMYGRIHGLHGKQLCNAIEQLIRLLLLQKVSDMKSSKLR